MKVVNRVPRDIKQLNSLGENMDMESAEFQK
jgi:hypothetical protein